ncbi:hypothetical protein QCA50_007486 [Cerrena zonata]|uniref:Uncharacterized protein n=1 Tax=Cerrena zonata TaxID=2478898 RepID=A0AAW0G8M2_9APHY
MALNYIPSHEYPVPLYKRHTRVIITTKSGKKRAGLVQGALVKQNIRNRTLDYNVQFGTKEHPEGYTQISEDRLELDLSPPPVEVSKSSDDTTSKSQSGGCCCGSGCL